MTETGRGADFFIPYIVSILDEICTFQDQNLLLIEDVTEIILVIKMTETGTETGTGTGKEIAKERRKENENEMPPLHMHSLTFKIPTISCLLAWQSPTMMPNCTG